MARPMGSADNVNVETTVALITALGVIGAALGTATVRLLKCIEEIRRQVKASRLETYRERIVTAEGLDSIENAVREHAEETRNIRRLIDARIIFTDDNITRLQRRMLRLETLCKEGRRDDI